MRVKITPSTAQGTIAVPPSKSLSHRAIICAALADGMSIISNVAFSDDVIASIRVMRQLGAQIVEEGDTLTVTGIRHFQTPIIDVVDCQESGSTLRFIIPLFSLTNQTITFIGKNRLLKRPMHIYEDVFQKQQCQFVQSDTQLKILGSIKSSDYFIDGSISSQFISGLLFTLPLLDGDSTITITNTFESKSYVDLTVSMLKTFQIHITEEACAEGYRYHVAGNQRYMPSVYCVEGDYSQLAFMAVLGAVNGAITCTGIRADSLQGDRVICDILRQTNADIALSAQSVQTKHSELTACDVSLADCPDLGPIVMVLAMYANGTFHLRDAGRLRIKESDRITAMQDGLLKLGVNISVEDNHITIVGQPSYEGNVTVSGFLDHRIVMSMAVAATRCKHPVIIEDAQAISKSYPNFFVHLRQAGIEVTTLDT